MSKSLSACFSIHGIDKETQAHIKALVKEHEAKGAENPEISAVQDMIAMAEAHREKIVQQIKAAGGLISSAGPDSMEESPQKTKGEINVTDEHSSVDLERDSGNRGTSDGVGQEGLRDDRRGNDRTGKPGIRGSEETGSAVSGDKGVSGYEAFASGERGDFSPYTEDGEPGLADSVAGDNLDLGSGGDSIGGYADDDRAGTRADGGTVPRGNTFAEKIAAQKKANSLKVVPGDRDNISETLPLLHKGQQNDVAFAEARFSKPEGYGVLFTNGTGTGKTFSALGIIKRTVGQGKENILIVVPDDLIVTAWTKAAPYFDLDVTQLADTKDKGSGVVITTYANFGSNDSLVRRKWDLVVADESHQLSMNKNGDGTMALSKLRAITMHPRGAYARHSALNRDEIAKLKELQESLEESKNPEKVEAQIKVLMGKLDEARKEIEAEVDAAQGAGRPRVVFLSATPFAYEKNVDYAEGYLFEFGKEDGLRYNSGGGFERFMMQHFGWRMRYNKLTEPDKDVNRGLMQRQFNSWLKKEGVLSSRNLDVDFDYDRKFVLVDSAIGAKIDEGMEWLFENKRFWPLWEHIHKNFDYLSRRYLLEAIKAKEVIPVIKEHLALNRKVVVYHDYIKGGGHNPFDLSDLRSSKETGFNYAGVKGDEEYVLGDLVREFETARPDLLSLPIKSMRSPLAALEQEFPDLLVVNGQTVTGKESLANVVKFNDDNTGPAVLMVQSDKDKGWSGHDTTGKYQRVLINLGLPTRPTRAIQQEGRIYRVGQASNAIFRYLNTGTNWERWAFATTIAARASGAENMAKGEEARALMDAFIQGFEESDSYTPGHDGEGTGGKERDAAATSALSEWDRATALYFAQQKKTSKNKAEEGKDYFATPEPLALKMVEWADIKGGESVLEPSAGHGAIARWFPENSIKTVVEPSPALAGRLKMVTDGKLLQHDFEDLHLVNKFDAIIMNPPFGTAGKLAMEHIAKASEHLRDGGRIVALIPNGPAMAKRLDNFLYGEDSKGKSLNPDMHLVAEYHLPAVTFERAGTKVMARVVIIDKVENKDDAAKIRQQPARDYTGENTVKDFFSRIENTSAPDRVKSSGPAIGKEVVSSVEKKDDTAKVEKQAGEEIVEHTTKRGKVIRGVIRKGITEKQALEIDPYTWAKDGGFFIREQYLKDEDGNDDANRYSQTDAKTIRPADIKEELRERLGADGLEALLSSGLLEIVDGDGHQKGGRPSKDGKVNQGITTKDNKVKLVQGSVMQGDAWAVLLHELGNHARSLLVSNVEYRQVLRTIERRQKEDSKTGEEIRKAMARVPAKTKKEHYWEEVLGYMIENNPDVSIVRRVVAIIKRMLLKMGISADIFSVEDFSALADIAVRGSVAEAKGGRNGNNERTERGRYQGNSLRMSERDKRETGRHDGGRRADGGRKGNGGLPVARNIVDIADILGNPSFKKWFGKSKITKGGLPFVLYHGTSDPDFLSNPDTEWTFDTTRAPGRASSPLADLGVFFGNETIANAHSVGTDGTTHAFFIRMENPYLITSRKLKNVVTGSEEARAFRNRLLLDGYDGVLIEDRGQVVIFDPNQAKSAEQNNGDFSLDNDDVRYSVRDSSEELQTKASAIAKQYFQGQDPKTWPQKAMKFIKSKLKDYRGFILGAFTLQQLDDLFGKDFKPVASFYKAASAISASTNRMMTESDKLHRRWAKLPKSVSEKMAETMHLATRWAIDPDTLTNEDIEKMSSRLEKARKAKKASANGLVKALTPQARARIGARMDRQIKYLENRLDGAYTLQSQFALLSDDAKGIYREVRDMHNQRFKELEEAIIKQIEKTTTQGKLRDMSLQKLRLMFDKQISRGPYFPLSRFGDFVVISRKMSDLNIELDRVVSSFETHAEAEAFAAEEEAKGMVVQLKTAKEYSGSDKASPGFANEVVKIIEDKREVMGPKLSDRMLDEVNQAFIKALPDMSHRKHFIHRKKVKGYTEDALRAFAASMQHAAHHIARIEHGSDLTKAVTDLDEMGRDKAGDLTLLGEIRNELTRRNEAINNPNIHPVAQLLTTFGFVFNIGPSIASAAVNLSQTPLVSFPYMAARYGWGKSGDALKKAMNDYRKADFSWDNGLSLEKSAHISEDERKMIKKLMDDGVIDVTQAHNLAAAASTDYLNLAGANDKAGKYARAMTLVSWPFHVTELANRQITALAAYRLARQHGHEEAMESAAKVVMATHFDYGAENRARHMQGNVARVILLFKQYSQNMTYILARGLQQSFSKKEDPDVKRIARVQLSGIIGGHFLVSGALGMPVVGLVGDILNTLASVFGDDDDPWDFETEVRQYLADCFGVDYGEAVAHGPMRMALPFDVASRLSLSDLWWRSENKELEGRAAFSSKLEAFLGPVVSDAAMMYSGLQAMADGETLRGMEMMLPKAAKDVIKTYRYSTEGVTNWKHDTLIEDVRAIELLGQLVGFSPSRVAEVYEGANAVKGQEARLSNRRSRLLNDIVQAKMSGNRAEERSVKREIDHWNEKNPEQKITLKTILKSLQARKRVRRNTEDGIYLPDTKDYLRDIGRFANTQ